MAKIEITPEMNATAKQFAQERGCTTDEAVEHIFNVGVTRLSALRKYAKRLAKGEVGGPKASKPATKKATKAKAAKAKGPIARKAKAAKAEAQASA